MTDTRCDLCNSEEYVIWEWETPNAEGLTMQEAIEKNLFYAEDPWWYVCDTCHRMILADRQESLLDRALTANGKYLAISPGEDGVWEKVDMTRHVRNAHAAFWIHKTNYKRLEE